MKDVAVVVYLDNEPKLQQEFRWLHKSWCYSGSNQTSDLIVFHHPEVKELPKDVTEIPLEPLTTKERIWSGYPFINSVYHLTTPEAAGLTSYRYILRTDCDCFLTPSFPNLRPRLATFGIGMYAQIPAVVVRLARIAEKWGILYNFNNVGSTFMMNSDLALKFSCLHMEYCHKLLADEFREGPGEWPGWFLGVLTMYAGNLAANAFFGTGLTLGGLDCHCMSQDRMCSTDYHIHAWHTYDYFSKFTWHGYGYKDIDMSALDPRKISDYCLLMAGPHPCE